MQILLACSKNMAAAAALPDCGCTEPEFDNIAKLLARQLALYSPDELQTLLNVNPQIASLNYNRYRHFDDESTKTPAIFAYDGKAFQCFAPRTMTCNDLMYANRHLMIGSFLYGMLRPLDRINRYRLEGNAELPCTDGKTLFNYWKPILTDWFINQCKSDDGTLINLASNEFKNLLDWRRVNKELTVITPEFKVEKEGKLKTIVIYAKMCRGAMASWIIRNRITDVDDLKHFEYEGFRYSGAWNYILG